MDNKFESAPPLALIGTGALKYHHADCGQVHSIWLGAFFPQYALI